MKQENISIEEGEINFILYFIVLIQLFYIMLSMRFEIYCLKSNKLIWQP